MPTGQRQPDANHLAIGILRRKAVAHQDSQLHSIRIRMTTVVGIPLGRRNTEEHEAQEKAYFHRTQFLIGFQRRWHYAFSKEKEENRQGLNLPEVRGKGCKGASSWGVNVLHAVLPLP